ncbi:uncharacterized protein [Clytia hemisphaerica]|uniref:uncharacterized protein n=1 Tax=Clytia hemisphaerica TaxID=252671 RepID=UPI0034D4B56E
MVERLNDLPTERKMYSGLKTVFMENDIPENEKGPAPAQFEVPFSAEDESYTSSSIILPAEPKDVSEEIKTIVKNVTESEDIANTFALADWKYADEEPLSELKTPGFFAQAFPSIFTGATCDFTHKPLVTVGLDEWIKHIYFQKDNRVSKHPFLKFFLYNLSLRKKALNNGNFLVAQQLTDSHISIEELQERFNNNDHSIPKKIIRMGSNLVNSDPYWNRCKRELDALLFFRRYSIGDLPSYFHTNSMAELHWAPLRQLLAKYLSSTCEDTYDGILNKLNTDMHFLRRTVLQNLHIATLYFESRTINYYNTVAKELFDLTDYWFRFEFAKSRGQIHSHGLIFAETHAKNIEQALDINGPSSDQEKAQALYRWLQTHEEDSIGIFSPGFVSMHPAGGSQVTAEDESQVWIPNKEKWPKPEGTQDPPKIDPLNLIMSDYCTTPEKVRELYLYL